MRLKLLYTLFLSVSEGKRKAFSSQSNLWAMVLAALNIVYGILNHPVGAQGKRQKLETLMKQKKQ